MGEVHELPSLPFCCYIHTAVQLNSLPYILKLQSILQRLLPSYFNKSFHYYL